MPSCHFVHLILLSSGPKVPKSGPFKNEGIHEPCGPNSRNGMPRRKRLKFFSVTSSIILYSIAIILYYLSIVYYPENLSDTLP
jgi:hypothetical protein